MAPFAYDGSGRRVWKSGTSFRPDGTAVTDLRRYVHDGEALLAELGESPGGGYHPVQRYLHGIGVLARERLGDDGNAVPTRRPDAGPGSYLPSSLQTLFHHADGLNSTVNVTGSDGSVKNAYLYDAWGNHRELEAGGACLTAPDLGLDGFVDRDAYLGNLASAFAEDDNRLTFTGLEAEPETGLFFAQSRFYDPEAGRFLSEDEDPGDESAPVSLHKYLYANASPTRFVDPSGRSAEDTVPAATLETGDLGGSESAARPSADQDLPEGGSLAAYEVAKSKARWPLSLSRAAPQHQGIWPECVSKAMDQWQQERDPDFDPIAKVRRVYYKVRSMARETYERTLRYAEDQWQQFKSDPFGFYGRKLIDTAELAWNLTFQPVIDAGKAGWEWASDPAVLPFV
ncbi:MAG: RHS repeat-associated core domain-containing protein [Acidobacteria bacterium]|nr:RHS repeat-associated core domain-containing protein [Acidobacteriota bacterium]